MKCNGDGVECSLRKYASVIMEEREAGENEKCL